ncbi:hypothetical protein K501DRAFT_277090 [Backusella circina FSU 941]|nr:hypothetical protein K501DRAFT_277090 [Backusella circina FSU 941]
MSIFYISEYNVTRRKAVTFASIILTMQHPEIVIGNSVYFFGALLFQSIAYSQPISALFIVIDRSIYFSGDAVNDKSNGIKSDKMRTIKTILLMFMAHRIVQAIALNIVSWTMLSSVSFVFNERLVAYSWLIPIGLLGAVSMLQLPPDVLPSRHVLYRHAWRR